jgi:hypothetical protein
MSPLMVAQYVEISLRFERRVLVVVTELMVARAMTFLCSSRAYTTLSCLISFQKGKSQARALVESVFMMHLVII